MWGSIILETYTNTNYSFSFPSENSQIILQLIHWQYWWWFWFTFFIVLYYLLFLRMLNFNLLKFSPKLVTSFRAHGKWGDFIVCCVPISWCLNILTNSNFILRMLEWQMESSLLTVRVRGKQWFWVYKFEVANIVSLQNTAKGIGNNIWWSPSNLQKHNIFLYLNLLQAQHSVKFLSSYWDTVYLTNFTQFTKVNFNYLPTTLLTHPEEFDKYLNLVTSVAINNKLVPHALYPSDSYINQFMTQLYTQQFSVRASIYLKVSELFSKICVEDYLGNINVRHQYIPTFNIFTASFWGIRGALGLFFSTDLVSNIFNICAVQSHSRGTGIPQNLNMVYAPYFTDRHHFSALVEDYLNAELNRLQKTPTKQNLACRSINSSLNVSVQNTFKLGSHSYTHLYWVMKQKRSVVKKQLHNYSNSFQYCYNNSQLDTYLRYTRQIVTFTQQYFSRRLLRTNRILLLPVNINITLITNSFDVIHSWYIPGLGIKLDCVPGRSTHHNLNIQSTGFYYGQCAEICGRYHHHMPIRICAVTFNQFVAWWSHFGLTKFNKTSVRATNRFVF